MEIGFFLSSEEHGPAELVAFAQAAETAGFRSALISDHYHPWLEEQGQSPFVWSVIGALAATTNLRVTTGVTCPTVRVHPAVIAQAAATCATMMPGRFRLGVGSGENLNEHILGNAWPPVRVRLQLLEEAVEIMRQLWEGSIVTAHTEHYTVENARLYTLPEAPPPVLVSAFGAKATEVAARIGDGFVDHQTRRRRSEAISRLGRSWSGYRGAEGLLGTDTRRGGTYHSSSLAHGSSAGPTRAGTANPSALHPGCGVGDPRHDWPVHRMWAGSSGARRGHQQIHRSRL